MYKSTTTSRVNDFKDHFIRPDINDLPPANFKQHLVLERISTHSWMQCKYFNNIYIFNNDWKYFYCSHQKCDNWFSFSGTIGNIKKYIYHKHLVKESEIKDINDISITNEKEAEITIPEEIDKLISAKFKKMILQTGRPFSLIEDNDMKSILKKLGSRSDLVKNSERIAFELRSQMKYILNSGSFISIAINEWGVGTKRR